MSSSLKTVTNIETNQTKGSYSRVMHLFKGKLGKGPKQKMSQKVEKVHNFLDPPTSPALGYLRISGPRPPSLQIRAKNTTVLSGEVLGSELG